MLGEKLHSGMMDLLRVVKELGMTCLQDDLTFPQIRIMMFIAHGKGPKMMAEAMVVTPAAVSKTIDALVQKGLVSRTTGEDRRSYDLALTASGKKLFAKFTKAVDGKLDQEISRLSVAEQKQLEQGLNVLNKLTTTMKEV